MQAFLEIMHCVIHQNFVLSIRTLYYPSELRIIHQNFVLSIRTLYYPSEPRIIHQNLIE